MKLNYIKGMIYLKIIALITALLLIGNGSYIQIKAKLAQILIERSFNSSMQHREKIKPWPWADTHVVAKLKIGDTTSYVLHDASMRNLAFGPAHLVGSALPGDNGNSVIVGHRDTHFALLKDIQIGQPINLSRFGHETKYRVEEVKIVDETDVGVIENTSQTALTLITCYPFNSITPDPKKRYVIRAVRKT